jgi:hypothetical protein
MMIKIVWTLIGLNALLFLVCLWEAMAKNSDPAGNGMASAFTGLIGIGLFFSLCLMMISRHPVVLIVSSLLSCGPILIVLSLINSFIGQFIPAKEPEPVPAEAYFSSEKQIALAKAIALIDTVQIRNLVSDGANVNAVEQANITPLQFAIHQITKTNEIEIRESIRTLISLGADPDTCLAEAVKFVSAPTIRILLEGGANPNQLDEFGDPLLFAVGAYGQPDVLQAFVENGVNIHVHNKEGWTPLMRLAYYGNWPAMIYLLEQGADYTYVTPDGKTVKSLLKEYYTNNGSNPESIPKEYVMVCQWLKKQGIEIY